MSPQLNKMGDSLLSFIPFESIFVDKFPFYHSDEFPIDINRMSRNKIISELKIYINLLDPRTHV